MDISEYTKQQGAFLKAEDVIAHPQVPFIITGDAEMVTSEKFGNERLHITGEFKAEQRTFDCSKTNARTVEKALGSDTTKWKGAKLVLETYKTKTSDGKMTNAINIASVEMHGAPIEKV